MTAQVFKITLIMIAVSFTAFFIVTIIPPLLEDFDVAAAIGAGFVNPFASGYSTDVIMCWFVLAAWVLYEAKTLRVKHGWVCLVLGLVPGVVVGFAVYLLIRLNYLEHSMNTQK